MPAPETRRDHTTCIRLSDTEQADVDREAQADGLTHVDGGPNRSAAIRRLVAEALEARRDHG